MTLKTCKDCIHGAICTICDYDDVLNVNDYCGYFKDKADVAEVKHGEWIIKCDDYDCELMCCSICESEFYDGDNDTVDSLHNYCPKCGAKMDQKEGAENVT